MARLRQRKTAVAQEREQQVLARSLRLQDTTHELLSENANRLSGDLRQIDARFWATADRSSPENNFWFKYQIGQVAGRTRLFRRHLCPRVLGLGSESRRIG